MMGACIRGFATSLLVIIVTGCGSSTAPSQNPLNLIGTWSGFVGAGSGGGRALRVTWTASQDGSTVGGPATLLTSPAVTNITVAGTLTGSLAGNQLSLRFTGSPVPGSASCVASGTGSATVSDGSAMSGSLDVTFASCESLDLQPPTDHQLTLTRQ